MSPATRILSTLLAGSAAAAVLSIALTPGWAGASAPAPRSCPYSSSSPGERPAAELTCPYSGNLAPEGKAARPSSPRCPVTGESPRPSSRPPVEPLVRIDRT